MDFLTTTYNQSYIQTYDFAYSGATIDEDVVQPTMDTIVTLKDQVEKLFLPNYSPKTSHVPWNVDNSLFAFWIGINDVNHSFTYMSDDLFHNLFRSYINLVEQVYETGARNFLFLNVPPVDRSPMVRDRGVEAQAKEKDVTAEFNRRLGGMVDEILWTYNGVRVLQYDTHSLFTAVLDDPTSSPETAGYMNVEDYCELYMK